MYTRCTTEKTVRQQRCFEQCLLDTMQKTPYAKISVSSLCEQTGLSRKTFYRLFSSKDDVLHALIDHTIMDYSGFRLNEHSLSPDSPAELQRFFSYWYAHKPLLDALSANNRRTLLVERTCDHVTREESNVLHRIGADILQGGRETVVFFVSGIWGLVIYWHQTGYSKSVSEISAIANRILMKPPVLFP